MIASMRSRAECWDSPWRARAVTITSTIRFRRRTITRCIPSFPTSASRSNCRCCRSPVSLSPKQQLYTERLERIEKDYQDYRVRRNAKWWRSSRRRSADYLLAAHDAETLSNTEVEELVRDRQLNQHVLPRWRKYLRRIEEVRRAGVPAVACRRGDSGQGVCRQVAASIAAAPRAIPLVRNGTGSAKQYPVLEDLAAAYAAALDEIRSRRAVRRSGPPSSFAPCCAVRHRRWTCPSMSSSSSTRRATAITLRSIRVRYNAMLAQAAYDGAPPRAMAVEDVPHPTPAHVFIRGNPNNPGALDAAAFPVVSGWQ